MTENFISTFTIVISSILITYIAYLIFSFVFMHSFKKKVNTSKRTLNILLYQKAQALYKICDLLDGNINEFESLKKFNEEKEGKDYKDIKPEFFREKYLELEDLYKISNKILIDKKIKNVDLIKKEFSVVEDSNERYFSASQAYNANVVGFNYWRNLFMTKWVKKLFGIKEIGLIS